MEDNSDSEFEMIHKKINQPIYKVPCDNVKMSNHEGADVSDFEHNELGAFHSLATDDIHKKVLLGNEDQTRSSYSKIRNSHSGSSSDSESDHKSIILKSNSPNARDNNLKYSKNSPIKSTLSESAKLKFQSDGHQMSDSSSDDSNNKRTTNFLHMSHENNDRLSPQKLSKDNLSEDEIPASQEPRVSLQFNLSTGKKEFLKPSHSFINKPSIASDTDISKSSDTDSEAADLQKDSTLDSHLSWLDQLLKQVTPVKKFKKRLNNNNLLFSGDITDEEELFLIQCPKQIDPKSFCNKKIRLDSASSITLENHQTSSIYDHFTLKNDSERFLNILLPNHDDSSLQLGRFTLTGNVILSQGVEVPELETPITLSTNKVQYPEKLADLCSSIPIADSSSACPNYCEFLKENNKNRKKKINEKDLHPEQELIYSEASKYSLKKKKKKNKDLPPEQELIYLEESKYSLKKKKNKGPAVNFEDIIIKNEPEDLYEERDIPLEQDLINSEESKYSSRKKKKKKSKDDFPL